MLWLLSFLAIYILPEQRIEQSHRRSHHDQQAEQAVQQADGIHFEARAQLVERSRQDEPPDNSAGQHASIADQLLYGMIRHDEAHTREESQEEEDYQGVAHRNGESREGVVPERSALAARLVGLGRFRVVGIGSEQEEQYAAQYLEVEDRGGPLDEVHHEAHAQARRNGVDEVAHSSPAARGKAVPAAFVEGTLNGQHPDWSHRSACHYSHHHASHGKVEGVH